MCAIVRMMKISKTFEVLKYQNNNVVNILP